MDLLFKMFQTNSQKCSGRGKTSGSLGRLCPSPLYRGEKNFFTQIASTASYRVTIIIISWSNGQLLRCELKRAYCSVLSCQATSRSGWKPSRGKLSQRWSWSWWCSTCSTWWWPSCSFWRRKCTDDRCVGDYGDGDDDRALWCRCWVQSCSNTGGLSQRLRST